MSCEATYSVEFSLFMKIKSLDILEKSLSVPNCKLVEHILHTFCLTQSWYDMLILGIFTVSKARGHPNFVLCKMNEGYFQLT